VDRRAIARSERRRQALAALEAERSRAAALREQLESIVTELEGPFLDEEIFGVLSPDQVAIVRPLLQPSSTLAAFEAEEVTEEWMLADAGLSARDPELDEAEIARLESELDASAARQEAFEQYLELLGRDSASGWVHDP
jgi:hypothetical protein